MKITIGIHDNGNLSDIIFIHDNNTSVTLSRKEIVSTHVSFEEWKKIIDRREFLTLEVKCSLRELSKDYLFREYPELCL